MLSEVDAWLDDVDGPIDSVFSGLWSSTSEAAAYFRLELSAALGRPLNTRKREGSAAPVLVGIVLVLLAVLS